MADNTNAQAQQQAGKEPVAEQPLSPPNVPLTAWTDVRRRLEEGDTYLLATVRPDARPHIVPVLAVWLDGALYFNARETTRKAKNLAYNSHCVMTVGDDTFDLVVEGEAAKVSDETMLHRVAGLFASKYPWWHPTVRDGVFYPDSLDAPPSDVYKVTPTIAFGFGKEKGLSATRWRF
jgi:nitroimidazol reductase NimA-like FMN-containing flavoprotein (pyridoxamine 5'-phosphate oxidase superfamily)